MKIAILICGQPRFTDDFNLLLNNLKGYDQADWFCYFTEDNQHVPHNKLPLDMWRKITDVNQASDNLQAMLPSNNFVKAFELSDSDYVELPKEPQGIPNTTYKSWYNLYKVNQLRLDYEKENNVNYDMILKIRPDIGLINKLDLSTINLENLKIAIITRKNKIAGHLHLSPDSPQMCDMFALACSEHMNIYCDMFNHATTNFFTQTIQSWHIESALALHLRQHNVFITPGNFKISIRGDAN